MAKTNIERLNEFSQSVWLDSISRTMVESGRLKEMIGLGLRGMTSNPTIFDKAIRLSNDYDRRIEELGSLGKPAFDIYDELTVRDVQDAADIFRDVYDRTDKLDGYVSLEVSPKLAFETGRTIEEAQRLFKKVNRPNVMFKIPATDAGFKAIEELLGEGININATLIFSLEQYTGTARAFLKGIAGALQKQKDLGAVHSVASVFVSRIDTKVDKLIQEKNAPPALKGKAALANSRLIYQRYLEVFSSDEFKELKEQGANAQRVLWASTSTKDPAYSDIKYVTELIGRDTVNTLPEATFKAFMDHGAVEEALKPGAGDAWEFVDTLKGVGIDIKGVCAKLLQEGLVAFEKSFEALLDSIEAKAAELCKK